jgi:formamidopyrimidine-DNA glycosylase
MPELPEVESVARTLRPLVAGHKIRCVHVLHPIAVKPQKPAQIVDLAEGRRIRAVTRLGKYLLLELDVGLLVMHFRLDGRLLWFSNAREFLKSANRKPGGVHLDVALEFSKGVLAFADRRHFGRVGAWAACGEFSALRQLGLDALSSLFTPELLANLLRKSKRPLKEFLLDQSRIAGIGNIYSAESLWRARLDPRREARSLAGKEAPRLHKAIVSVLHRALECCLHPPPNFRDPEWWFQGLERILRVYNREGKACRRCAGIIRRIEQGGRSTYCCLGCQR